jgi:tRNA-dihydrouridine synthase B
MIVDSTIPSLTLRGTAFCPALFCAPMAGITHSAFRRLLADFGGYGALFTEMLAAKMVLHENTSTSPWLKRRPQEGKVIYQLLVTDTVQLPEILDRLAPLSPDGLDLNSACSAYNVRRQGGGSDLFDDWERLRDIVQVMRRHFAGPFTVKIRLGRQTPHWREHLRDRLRLLEDEGVDALTLHPRFAEESLNRSSRHALYCELIAETRLPVIANGDITGADFMRTRREEFASASGLMVGRMAAAQPWVFARWHNPALVVDPAEVWQRLCGYISEDFPPHKALVRIKILAPYFARNFVFGHTLFSAIQSAPDLETALTRASRFLTASPPIFRDITLAGI